MVPRRHAVASQRMAPSPPGWMSWWMVRAGLDVSNNAQIPSLWIWMSDNVFERVNLHFFEIQFRMHAEMYFFLSSCLQEGNITGAPQPARGQYCVLMLFSASHIFHQCHIFQCVWSQFNGRSCHSLCKGVHFPNYLQSQATFAVVFQSLSPQYPSIPHTVLVCCMCFCLRACSVTSSVMFLFLFLFTYAFCPSVSIPMCLPWFSAHTSVQLCLSLCTVLIDTIYLLVVAFRF